MIDQRALLLYPQNQRVIFRNEECMYVKPHAALQQYISNYTLTFPGNQTISEEYTIIPHGCATLTFALKNHAFSSRLFGPATKAARVGDQAGSFDQIVIVEFQPAGLYPFLGLKQNELADQLFPFELVQPRLNQAILNLLETAKSVQELLSGIDHLFLQAILANYPRELMAATKTIIRQTGNVSLKNLSHEAFYSERHLTRLFNEHLGMSTKTFSRLVRVNQTIRLLNQPQGDITTAYETAGYYDFSHFNRDFKLVTGNTPQAYQQKMSDFYSEIAKF